MSLPFIPFLLRVEEIISFSSTFRFLFWYLRIPIISPLDAGRQLQNRDHFEFFIRPKFVTASYYSNEELFWLPAGATLKTHFFHPAPLSPLPSIHRPSSNCRYRRGVHYGNLNLFKWIEASRGLSLLHSLIFLIIGSHSFGNLLCRCCCFVCHLWDGGFDCQSSVAFSFSFLGLQASLCPLSCRLTSSLSWLLSF